MLRVGLRSKTLQRSFQSSLKVLNSYFGSPAEGPYSNLPFKVKNRVIPFNIVFWSVCGVFLGFPIFSTWLSLKRSGALDTPAEE